MFVIKKISIQLELSSPPSFWIQGGTPLQYTVTDGGLTETLVSYFVLGFFFIRYILLSPSNPLPGLKYETIHPLPPFVIQSIAKIFF